VLKARDAQPDRMLEVVQVKARCANVVLCRCGTLMLGAGQRHLPARPTRRSSRPLRAQDRSVLQASHGALAAAERQSVGRDPSVSVASEMLLELVHYRPACGRK
jgi:hypothetical protein